MMEHKNANKSGKHNKNVLDCRICDSIIERDTTELQIKNMATIEQKKQLETMQRLRDIEICSDFKALKRQYPDIGAYTIFDTLADKYRKGEMKLKGANFPITGMGVRNIVIKHGLYSPRKQSAGNQQ